MSQHERKGPQPPGHPTGRHIPSVHRVSAGQRRPHPPQFKLSDCTGAHAPAQHCSPGSAQGAPRPHAGRQALLTQRWPAGQSGSSRHSTHMFVARSQRGRDEGQSRSTMHATGTSGTSGDGTSSNTSGIRPSTIGTSGRAPSVRASSTAPSGLVRSSVLPQDIAAAIVAIASILGRTSMGDAPLEDEIVAYRSDKLYRAAVEPRRDPSGSALSGHWAPGCGLLRKSTACAARETDHSQDSRKRATRPLSESAGDAMVPLQRQSVKPCVRLPRHMRQYAAETSGQSTEYSTSPSCSPRRV